MADTDKEKLAKALKLKAQARLRQKQANASKDNVTTPESSWYDTMRNTAANIPSDTADLVSGLYGALTDPVGTVKAVGNLGAGALEAVTPGSGYVNELNNWLRSQGVPLAELPTDGPSPNAQMAQKAGSDFVEAVKHPAVTFSNKPVSTLFDLATLIAGGAGKIPRMARSTLDMDALVDTSKAAKDAKYATVADFPEANIDAKPIAEAAMEQARRRGYDKNYPQYEGNQSGADLLEKTGSYANLQELQNLRQGVGTLNPKSKMQPDNAIVEAMREGFDNKIAEISPEGSAALTAARDANTLFRNNQALVDIIQSGKVRSAISGSEGSQIQRGIAKTLADQKKRKGLPEEAITSLRAVLDTPSVPKGVLAQITQMGLPSMLGGALGGTIGGPWGAMGGAAIAGGADRMVRAVRTNRATNKITGQMTDLLRELNGLPPAKRKLKWDSLSKKTRAALIAAGAGDTVFLEDAKGNKYDKDGKLIK